MFDLYSYIFDFTPIKQKVTLYPLFSITSSIFGSSLTCKFWWVLQLLWAIFGFQVLLSAQRELRQRAIRWASGTFEEEFPVDWIHIAKYLLQFRGSVSIKFQTIHLINFVRLMLAAFAVFYVNIVNAMRLRTAFRLEADYFIIFRWPGRIV